MVPVSALVTLYTAVYGKPPSSHSTAALLAMEQILGLTAEDPLSRMMIVLVHTCDRVEDAAAEVKSALQQRSADEKEVVSDTTSLVREIKNLKPQLDKMAAHFDRYRNDADRMVHPFPAVVDTHRHASPMLTYLRKAFDRRNSVDDHDNVVGAARSDMLLTFAVVVIAVVTGIGIGFLLRPGS